LDSISCYYFNFRQELGLPHLNGSSQPVVPEHSNGGDSRKIPDFLTQTHFPASIRYRHPKVKLPNTTFFHANQCVNLSITEMGERMLYSSVWQPLDSSKHGTNNKQIANTKSSIFRANMFYINRYGD
jgi:hypothetical protein